MQLCSLLLLLLIWHVSYLDIPSDLTLNHLFHCAYNLFKANKDKKSGKFPSGSPHDTKIPPESSTNTKECQTGASLTKMKNVNMVKALTSILKFVVDATAMDLVPHYQEWCLNFTTENLRFVIKSLRELSTGVDDLKDLIICLKSLFTYGVKLLNVVLKKSGEVLSHQRGAYNLVNELLNLTVAVEELLGYGCAARFSTVVQPWVPDLAIALGSYCLLEETMGEGCSSDSLKGKNLDTVLGVLHFVCRKLVRVEDWKELKLMLVSLEKVYCELDTEAEKQDFSEGDMQKLYGAKTLLEPVWTSFIYEEGRNQMEEE